MKYNLIKSNKNDIILSKSQKSQIKWQKKQIDIYYNNGRPIFNYYSINGYLIYDNPYLKKKTFMF